MPSHPLRVTHVPLRNSLVNLPSRFVGILSGNGTIAQSLIVELIWDTYGDDGRRQRSLYAGWTGLASSSMVDGGGALFSNSEKRSNRSSTLAETVEIDPAFAQGYGLAEGLQVSLSIHSNPIIARAVHIEPKTVDDWDLMELHASFLETNLLSQIRAVVVNAPLTIYLTDAVTVSVVVTDIEPQLPNQIKFAKLSQDSEVIVAPKSRNLGATKDVAIDLPGNEVQPVDSMFKAAPIFRVITLPHKLVRVQQPQANKLYVNMSELVPELRAAKYWKIKVARPLEKNKESEEEGSKFNEDLYVSWVHCDVPLGHVALTETTAFSLQLLRPIGEKLQIHPTDILAETEANEVVLTLPSNPDTERHLRLRSQANDSHGDGEMKLRQSICNSYNDNILTNGQLVEISDDTTIRNSYSYGLLRLPSENHKTSFRLPTNPDSLKVTINTIPSPISLRRESFKRPPNSNSYRLVGLKDTMQQCARTLRRGRGVLITGRSGSGKSIIAKSLSDELEDNLFYTNVFPCSAYTEERIPIVKDLLDQLFVEAVWHQPSVLIFDDFDRLFSAEVEHSDSSRVRHLSEVFLQASNSILSRQQVAILSTAVDKESVHNTFFVNHTWQDIVHLKTPSKAVRSKILIEGLRRLNFGTNRENFQNLFPIAVLTEGFAAGDLHLLCERACQEHIKRMIQAKMITKKAILTNGTNGSHSDLCIQNSLLSETPNESDFKLALENFTTAGLRGVKLQTSQTTWHDIGGLEGVKQTLLETLEWPTKYAPIFAKSTLRLRSGILLYGYPGCGKTMLASAVARECGLNFISVKGPEILNKYIGASEKSVRELFDRAQSAKPCVLFFDEFESIAPKRGHDSTGVTDRVVNQLLTQMDGAEGLEGVYVLAATSRPDLIDSALLRPGRLDKSLLCGMPDISERKQILDVLAQRMQCSSDVSLDFVAAYTENFTGADLQALLYNAHIDAVHERIEKVDTEDISHPHNLIKRNNEDYISYQMKELLASDCTEGLSKPPHHIRDILDSRVLNVLKHEHTLIDSTTTDDNTSSHVDILIKPHHISAALQTTKRSVPAVELLRLRHIYDEYASGRDGVFPNGLASTEIGGRASLM